MHHRKPAFFSLPALLALAGLLLVALYLLFPRQAIFEDPKYLETPDSISLAYLETLLKSDSSNQTLRLNLSRMQQKVGEHTKAMNTLAPLLEKAEIPFQAMATQTELLRGAFFRATPEAQRPEIRDRLAATLDQALDQDYSIIRKQALATDVLPLLGPGQQLRIRQELFHQALGPSRFRLGQKLARHQEAMNNPEAAKNTLERILPLVPPSEATRFHRNLIRLELATGNPAKALAIFQARHQDKKLSPELLREGIRLATLAGQQETGAHWLALLARAEPTDLDVQRRYLALQLGRGDVHQALATVRRMETSGRVLARTDKERIARVYEWNNRPEKALGYWRGLFLDQPRESAEPVAYNHAIRLAESLYQWPTLVELLQLRADRGHLAPDGYLKLAEALISTGELDVAGDYLAQGIQRFPDNPSLRQRQFVLLVNRRQFGSAIDLLKAAPALTEAETLRLANLYWRTRDPESALATLAPTLSNPELEQEAAAMRLDLARTLNRQDLLRRYYDSIANLPDDELSPEVRNRMIGLSWQFGSPEQTLVWSRQQYQESGDLRHLITIAQLQDTLNRFEALAQSLAHWDRDFTSAQDDPRYWLLKARLYQSTGRINKARSAYQESARLAPDNTDMLISWGWLLLSQPDRLPGPLPRILSLLADSPSPNTYPLQVYGHAALGEPELADAWLAAAREQLGSSPDQLLSLSRYARSNGARTEAEAEALRQLAVASKQPTPDPELLARLHSVLRDPQPEPVGPRYRFDNRALQAGFQLRDLGGFSVQGATLSGQFSHDHYRWLFAAEQSRPLGKGQLRYRPDPGASGRLQWQSNNRNYLLSANLDSYSLASGEQLSAGLELTSQPSDGVTLGAGMAFGERVTNSAEAWWLTSADRVSVTAGYTPWPRLTISGRADYLSINEAFGGEIGEGYDADLTATYSLFRNDPAWRVSLGYQSRQLTLGDSLRPETQARLNTPMAPGGLLSDDYRRVGITSEWSHGEPHALYRTVPSPRYFFALDSGYVLSTSSFNFGARMGLGWRIAGDDELAFSAGYSTDSLDGKPRADAKLTYTLYFGH